MAQRFCSALVVDDHLADLQPIDRDLRSMAEILAANLSQCQVDFLYIVLMTPKEESCGHSNNRTLDLHIQPIKHDTLQKHVLRYGDPHEGILIVVAH